MCALFGWLDYKGIVPYKISKKLTQALANAAEERGTDASGIAYVKNGSVTVYKRPKPSHKVHFNAPEGTRAVMGHTRLTTQGNQKFNFNNHPFPGHADKEFAFAHNGVLYNDKELRRRKNLPATHIETDSYIAIQLIEQQKKLDFESLKSMAEAVEGSFCFTALDEDNTLYIVKGSNPMCLFHFEILGLYIYASTESIMSKALKKAGLHKFPYTKIETAHGDIIRIDSNGNLVRSEFEGKEDFRYSSWLRYSYAEWEDDYYTQHEQLLLEMCNCYGVDEDDVMLLLDYGYSADEIEDMLCDYSLITDTIMAVKGQMDYDNFLCEI
jgi:glucosamine 6-phosphate synthetase-like amidotransferase/phosphosugar isomerase protein